MLIVSNYRHKCKIVRTDITDRYPDLKDRGNLSHRILRNCVGTVSSCQRVEYDFIIFTAGRVTMSNRPFGQDYLLDSLRNMYCMTT